MQRTGLPDKKAEVLRTAVGMSEEEFREKHHAKLRAILEKLAERIEGEIDELSPAQKAVTFGIISDKLNAAPKSVVNALHLHFKNNDRGSALRALLGREGQRSVSRAGQPRAKVRTAPAPVIDAVVLPSDDTAGSPAKDG